MNKHEKGTENTCAVLDPKAAPSRSEPNTEITELVTNLEDTRWYGAMWVYRACFRVHAYTINHTALDTRSIVANPLQLTMLFVCSIHYIDMKVRGNQLCSMYSNLGINCLYTL